MELNNVYKKLKFYIHYIAYEIVYYVLGGRSIVEDVLLANVNKCELVKKTGQVAIVTGGARGIGAALVAKLLECDMTVIIGCRSVSSGESTVAKIREKVASGKVYIFELDLLSFKSVKLFAKRVLDEFNHLNLLVNNAGIMFPPYSETEDGYESQWEVNYMSPFLLTHLLYPLLKQASEVTGNARVVNVTSCAHEVSMHIDFNNINMKNWYIPSAAYAQSKLAQVLFTIELDRRLAENGSKVRILSVHPGIVNTDLFNGSLLKVTCPWVLKYICKNVKAGAISILYPCLSPQIENKGGVYISNCRVKDPSSMAQDKILQKKLFDYSMKSLGINEFGS